MTGRNGKFCLEVEITTKTNCDGHVMERPASHACPPSSLSPRPTGGTCSAPGSTNPAPPHSPALFHKAPGGNSYITLQLMPHTQKQGILPLQGLSIPLRFFDLSPFLSATVLNSYDLLQVLIHPRKHRRQPPVLDPMATKGSSLNLPHMMGAISPARTLSLQPQCGLPLSLLMATWSPACRSLCLLCRWHLGPSVSPSCSYVFECFLSPGYVPRAY